MLKTLLIRAEKFLFLFVALSLVLAYAPSVNAVDISEEVIFFGDSTTAHLAVRAGIPKSRVWSGAESTVRFSTVNTARCVHLPSGEDVTFFQAMQKIKPSMIVITLGVSGGAGVLSEKDFKAIYGKMLSSAAKASPNTKVYVQSILPLASGSAKYYKKLTKEAVVTANGWIREVCDIYGVPYINTHDLLTDENGYLKREYQNDEYMHLTAKAYKVVLESISGTINETDRKEG